MVLSRSNIFSASSRSSSPSTLPNSSTLSPGKLSGSSLAAFCVTHASKSFASRWLSRRQRLGLDSRWQLTSLPPALMPLSTSFDLFKHSCPHPTSPSAQPIRVLQRHMPYGAARSPHLVIKLWTPSSKMPPPSICIHLRNIKHGLPTFISETNAPKPSGLFSVSKA